ncbi:hypothetical protein ABZZ20_23240 [Streptomyces sp. NPDC006430]|uniref:hypothetical protein n=1 Tax=Streptomyces sp. NPDC006430 TaxID=3154299 RepID=UPI0033B98A28
MSWNPQIDATDTTDAAPALAPSMGMRGCAGIGAVLFLPALVAAKILVLMSETGSRCLMYGGCRAFPFALFVALIVGAVAAFAVTMAAPRRFQGPALTAQLLLEAVGVGLVLAYP